MSELLFLFEGQLAGSVSMEKSGRLSLTYDESWIARPDSYSLSASMPLAQTVYPHKQVSPYLWKPVAGEPQCAQTLGPAIPRLGE
jgi:HipA-like protein